jgi:chromosomal replication initiator protein
MTCDKAPKDLVGMEDRLISRFKWGLTADLQAPDLETRIAILESKMNEENLEFSNQVKEYVAYNIKNNIRELEGVLISLVAHASINKKSIDINLAREVIQQFVANVHTDISVENILQMVAEHFDIDLKKMQGNTRKREVVVARQLSMYLAKAYTKTSLKMIGNHFGGKDHSTVIYSCRAVQDLIDTDAKFKTAVESLERRLKLGMQAN